MEKKKSDLLLRFDQWSSWCRRLVRKKWERVLAGKATRGWFDVHYLEDYEVRVQSPGVSTQSVMSTVVIRSNLMGHQRTDHGYRKWFRRGERKSAGRTRRPSTFKCTWYLARTPCRHRPHSVPCPFGSFLSDWWRQPDFEDRKRARQKLPSLMAENRNSCMKCAHLSPTPGFFAPFYYCQCLCPYGQRCSDTNDGLFERRVDSVYNVHLHI